jgi:hypothetical protein
MAEKMGSRRKEFALRTASRPAGGPQRLLYNWYPPTSDMKLISHLHVLPILEYVDICLHSRNVLIVSVQIIVVNFITLVKINFKENLQYSYFKIDHYVAGVEEKEPRKTALQNIASI